MGATPRKPEFRTVTWRAKAKKRFALVTDPAVLSLMKVVGKALTGDARFADGGHGTLVGVFALPTNNVIEIYADDGGCEKGFLFTSLDVWMSWPAGVDHE